MSSSHAAFSTASCGIGHAKGHPHQHPPPTPFPFSYPYTPVTAPFLTIIRHHRSVGIPNNSASSVSPPHNPTWLQHNSSPSAPANNALSAQREPLDNSGSRCAFFSIVIALTASHSLATQLACTYSRKRLFYAFDLVVSIPFLLCYNIIIRLS